MLLFSFISRRKLPIKHIFSTKKILIFRIYHMLDKIPNTVMSIISSQSHLTLSWNQPWITWPFDEVCFSLSLLLVTGRGLQVWILRHSAGTWPVIQFYFQGSFWLHRDNLVCLCLWLKHSCKEQTSQTIEE